MRLPRRHSAPRPRAWVATLAAAAAAGCVGSPAWRFDRFVVAGELRGRTCRVTLDGRDVTAQAGPFAPDSVSVGPVAGSYVGSDGRAMEQRLIYLSCAGFGLVFADGAPAPAGAADRPDARRVPRTGAYVVAPGVPASPDRVGAGLSSAVVSAGRWPFAIPGVTIDGQQGWVMLDSVRADGAVGRFRFVGRRRVRGP